MANSLNKVTLIGYMGKDPEVRLTQEGSKIVTLVLATSEQWKDRLTEEQKERTEWHRIIIFNTRFADIAERFLKKGQRVYIEGQLQSRKWTDAQGQEHRVQEIILRYKGDMMILDMPRRKEGEDYQHTDNNATYASTEDMKSLNNSMASYDDIDDEIPF